MSTKTAWAVSDISNPIQLHLNELEFKDNNGDWQHFTLIVTEEKIVFGGCCNVGFIESGYILREENESLNITLIILHEELETYYNDGPNYVSRIVCNERM